MPTALRDRSGWSVRDFVVYWGVLFVFFYGLVSIAGDLWYAWKWWRYGHQVVTCVRCGAEVRRQDLFEHFTEVIHD